MCSCVIMSRLAVLMLPLIAISGLSSPEAGFLDHPECYGMDMLPETSSLGALCGERNSGFGSDEEPDPMFDSGSHAIREKVPSPAYFGWYRDDRDLCYCAATHAENGERKQMESLIIEQRIQIDDLKEIVKKLEQTVEMLQDRSMSRMDMEKGPESLRGLTSPKAHFDGHISPLVKKLREGVVNQISVDGEETDDRVGRSMSATDSLVDTGFQQHSSQRKFPHRFGAQYHGGITVARYKPAWSEYFQFLSALKVDGEVTCLHVLPHEGEENLSRYVAVGVNTGRVYVFLSHGDLLVDFLTVSAHPVTAMLSFVVRRNETMFLTGHSDGSVLVHTLCETTNGHPHSDGDDLHTLHIEHVKSLTIDYARTHSSNHWTEKSGVSDKSITILEVYRAGKMRYILATNADGEIYVFRENGTFYGATRSSSQPLAFLRSPNLQRLLFLTEHGVASLDLRSLSIQTQSCNGLNGSRVVAYSFDAAGRSKAYGFTAEGDIIYVALSGDTLHFECNVRFKKKFKLEGPVILQGIKGYLLVRALRGVFVYNTTLQVGSSYKSILAGMPRLLFTASMDEISVSFSNKQIPAGSQPLMACNQERLVVLGFGDGYIGIYKSNLPSQKHVQYASKFWNSPLFIMIVILLGGWYFFAAKRRDGLLPAANISGTPFSLSPTTSQVLRSTLDES